jgi:hypothetical protein
MAGTSCFFPRLQWVPVCLTVTDFPGGLNPNYGYITDDTTEFMNYYKQSKREVG